MRLQETLRKFRNQFNAKRRIQRPQRESRRQLRLEQLEERTLPSISFIPGPYATPFINPGSDQPQGSNWGYPLEPALAVNPTNAANIVLSSHNAMELSTDGGATYPTFLLFPAGWGGGDTSTVFDSQGRLFWSNLAKNAGDPFGTPYVAQINPTTGAVIGSAVEVSPPSGTGAYQDDKDVLGTDGTNLYIVWERYFSGGDEVLLSRSTNQGATWSSPTVVSDPSFGEGFVWGSTVTALSDGSISVAYHASVNNGEVLVANYTNDLHSRYFKTTVMTNVYAPGSFPNEPWTNNLGEQESWVIGDGSRAGQVYVVFLNYPNVVFARSTNYGATWTTTNIVAGSDPGNWEAYPTAAIDQFGNIGVTWYTNGADNFDSSGYYLLDVDAMYSTDGGLSWSAPFQVNQDHHFDPNATRINDYFAISVFAGTAYIAWNGNTFDNNGNVTGQQLWTNQFGMNGSLTVSGDSATVNTINLYTNPDDGLETEVSVNGTVEYVGPLSGLFHSSENLSSITVLADNANDTVNVEDTYFGTPLTINEGGGTDTVNISPTAEFVGNIQGDVFVNGGSGTDTLNVTDQNDGSNFPWTITGSTVNRQFSGVIHYNLQNNVNITGGTGNVSYNIQGTEPFFTTNLDTGPGSDAVNVQGTSGTLAIDNLFSTANHDTVTIGSIAPSLGGTLANIAGPVNVSNSSGGGTTLKVDDSGDTAGQTFTVTNGSISGYWSGSPITYTGGQVNWLNLLGGSGANIFNVQSTASGTTTNVVANPAGVFTSKGATVNVGNAGSVQGIAGTLNIENPPNFDNINIDDSSDPGAPTAVLSLLGVNPADSEGNGDLWGQISSLAPGNINYEYPDVGFLHTVTVNGALGGTTFQVHDVPNVNMILNGTGTMNTLDGPNKANSWTLDAALGGILDSNITFNDIQNLVGGTGTDTFDLASPVPIASNIQLNSNGTLNVAASAPAANILLNQGFDTVGPLGSPVAYTRPSPGGVSAAADWYQFMGGPPNSTATTELLPSTDPLPGGGGQMLHFSTNGGFYKASGNGVFENLSILLPQGSIGAFDLYVPAGTAGEIGFGDYVTSAFDSGAAFFGSQYGQPTGVWYRVSFPEKIGKFGANEIGLEIFSAGGGQIYVDNAFASTASSGAQFLTGAINNNGHLLTVTGAGKLTLEGVVSGSGGLSMQGTNTLTLWGTNSYSGNTTIVSGTLIVSGNATLGAAGTSTTVDSGASLALYSVNYTTPEHLFLNGSGVGGAGALENLWLSDTFDGSNTLSSDSKIAAATGTTLTLTGTIDNGGHLLTMAGPGKFDVTGLISGSGGLKQIKGTVILSANNTYTGPTTTNGTLVVNGLQPNSSITVNSGGVLAGTGSVGAVTVNTGGTVAPGPLGGKGMGTLTVASANFSAGGTLLIYIPKYGTPGVDYDQLNVIGSLTLGGTSKIAFDLENKLNAPGTAFGIVLYASHSGVFTTVKPPIHNPFSRSVKSLNYNPTSLDVVFN